MCYAGGPYCDGYAKQRFQKASQALKENPSDDKLKKFKESRIDYDGTPMGQAELDQKIAKSTDKFKTNQLLMRKEQAQYIYNKKLEAAKAKKASPEEHAAKKNVKPATRRIAIGRVEVNESFPHPQANRLDKVSTTVDAIEAGANTAQSIAQSLDIVDRQGYYYGDAAGYLGFVDSQSNGDLKEYYLTEKGQAFVGANPEQRKQILSETINNMPLMQVYREDGEEGALDFVRDSQDVNDVTAQRRVATLKTWDSELKSQGFSDSIAQDQSEGKTRFVDASAYAKEQRAKKVQKPTEHRGELCQECFVEKSVTGKCGCDD